MRQFIARTKSDKNIITVLAGNIGDAIIKIKTELTSNPSRRQYYSSWKAGGKRIVEIKD